MLALGAVLVLAFSARPGFAEEAPADTVPPTSLAVLAGSADFLALAQVRDTDYLRRRDIPVSGSAYLRVLIPYKGGREQDLVEVYEKGLHENECYFPNPSVFEEGRRFLLFLRRDRENQERYRGLPQGCAIEVLVDRDNRYAVRMPVTGLQLSSEQQHALHELAQPMEFSDPYAVVDDEALPPAQRDAMAAAGQIAPYAPEVPTGQWKYTLGIPLVKFRELLRLEPWEPALPAK